MKRLNKAEINDTFSDAKRKFGEFAEDSGFGPALKEVSRALDDLRRAGHDVSLEVFGDASEQAYDMFKRNVTVPVSGILRIGDIHRLFAIATRVEDKPALQIALSHVDIRFHGFKGKINEGQAENSVKSVVFDVKNDPEAIVKFEKEIIEHLARNSVVNDNDEAQTFDSAGSLRKLSVKPK